MSFCRKILALIKTQLSIITWDIFEMLIELRYQCYIHACSGNYLGNIFLLFFLPFSDFFVWSVRTVCFGTSKRCSCMSGRWFWLSERYCWFIRTSILLVRKGMFLRSPTWHSVRTSLKFHLEGEACKVKSHSPCVVAFSFASFGSFSRVVHLFCDFYA
jgi:hypothetical protein